MFKKFGEPGAGSTLFLFDDRGAPALYSDYKHLKIRPDNTSKIHPQFNRSRPFRNSSNWKVLMSSSRNLSWLHSARFCQRIFFAITTPKVCFNL